MTDVRQELKDYEVFCRVYVLLLKVAKNQYTGEEKNIAFSCYFHCCAVADFIRSVTKFTPAQRKLHLFECITSPFPIHIQILRQS